MSQSVKSKNPCKSVIQTPSGYKQTDIGMVPEDWDVKAIGGIADVKGGKRLPAGRSVSDVPTPYPYIRVTDMFHGGVSLNDIKYVPVDVFPSIKNYTISREDIFITVAGTLGIVGKVPPELDGANLTENADKITSISCDRDYLLHVLMSVRIQNTIESEKTVGAQPKLALARIQRFQVALPNAKAEQRAIATALSDVDSLISSLDKLNAKKRDIKQAAMQQLLTGKTRLPGFSGEWEVKKLADIAPLQRGFDLPSSQLQAGVYPVVYSNGVLNQHSSFKVKAPGVVTGRSGTIGRVHYIEDDYWPHNTSLWVTEFKGNVPRFVYYLYRHLDLERFATGSGVPTLNRNDVHAHRMLLPLMAGEQQAITAVLSDMDAEIAALERRRDKTRALKQGMMQELLTGRTRLV